MRDPKDLYATDFLTPLQKACTSHSSPLPCVNRSLINRAMTFGSGWRYPLYSEWMKRSSFLKDQGRNGDKKVRGLIKWIGSMPLQPLIRASYVEWRYYSILSDEFHGIVGVALFNPENRLAAVSEGGLLVIVTGVLNGGAKLVGNDKPVEEVCWMKLFPTDSVRISGGGSETVDAGHRGVKFHIEHFDVGDARIRLSGDNAPTVDLHLLSIPRTSLHPVLAEDLRRVPGAHWVVHVPALLARMEGSVSFSSDLLTTFLPLRSAGKFPLFVSEELRKRALRGNVTLKLSCNGYYEHSFGMNPMPLHGWDFCYAPDHEKGSAFVMQTYLNSEELRYVEVIWTEGNEQRYTRFMHDEFELTWKEKMVHPDMKVEVPLLRTITARKGGLTLEVENRIVHHIPLLRPEKYFVRHFFISEEIGLTSWILKDSSGRVLSEVRDRHSGGETAHPRRLV